MKLQSFVIHAAIAAGALLAGALFRLVAGDAAVVLAPVLAVGAVAWASRRRNAERNAAAPAEKTDAGEVSA